MNLKQIGLIAGTITAVAGAAGAVGYTVDRPAWYSELQELAAQVASNSQAVALQRWQYLHQKKQTSGLDPYEQAEYCALSKRLGFPGIGCR